MFDKKIIVRVGGKQIEGLEIDFKVILDEDEDNTATITIYNLSKTTREEIKENVKIHTLNKKFITKNSCKRQIWHYCNRSK